MAEHCHHMVSSHTNFVNREVRRPAVRGHSITFFESASFDSRGGGCHLFTLKTAASAFINLALQTELAPGLSLLVDTDWSAVKALIHPSAYIQVLSRTLLSRTKIVSTIVSPECFLFLVNVITKSFLLIYQAALFHCQNLSETSVRRLILDTEEMRSFLRELPVLGSQISYSDYCKTIHVDMVKINGYLKTVTNSTKGQYHPVREQGKVKEMEEAGSGDPPSWGAGVEKWKLKLEGN